MYDRLIVPFSMDGINIYCIKDTDPFEMSNSFSGKSQENIIQISAQKMKIEVCHKKNSHQTFHKHE